MISWEIRRINRRNPEDPLNRPLRRRMDLDSRIVSASPWNPSKAWLQKQVRAQGYRAPSEIFLLSLDGAGKILCIGKDNNQ